MKYCVLVAVQRFLCGPKFCGVKMIPPGPHLISYSAVSKEGAVAPTVFFPLFLAARDVVVREWDVSSELLLPVSDEDQVVF